MGLNMVVQMNCTLEIEYLRRGSLCKDCLIKIRLSYHRIVVRDKFSYLSKTVLYPN